MEVNLQIFHNGQEICISEPNKQNEIIINILPQGADEYTTIILNYEAARKIDNWLSTQCSTMYRTAKENE